MLMQNGANINALTKDGFCPFENKHKKMILQLLNLLNHSNDMGLIRKFHKPHSLRLPMAMSMNFWSFCLKMVWMLMLKICLGGQIHSMPYIIRICTWWKYWSMKIQILNWGVLSSEYHCVMPYLMENKIYLNYWFHLAPMSVLWPRQRLSPSFWWWKVIFC